MTANDLGLMEGFKIKRERLRVLEDLSITMISDLIYFCKRVDEGTIRSKTTYRRYMKTISEALPHLSWDDIKKIEL